MKAGKVWGETKALLQNPVVEFHRIEVVKGGECSTHKHSYKWNGFFIEKGEMEIQVFKNDYDLVDKTTLHKGDFMAVKPGEYHLFRAITDCIAFEIYWPEMLSEDIQRKSVGKVND